MILFGPLILKIVSPLDPHSLIARRNPAPILCHFNLCALSSVFGPCDQEIWQMTLKNNRASLLCHFKLCVIFHSHLWIQTESGNAQFGPKSLIFRPVWSRNLMDNFEKQYGSYFMPLQALCIIYIVAICEFKLELWSRNNQIGTKFVLTSMTLTFDLDFGMDITSVNGNYSQKFNDNTMRETLWKRCDRRMYKVKPVYLPQLCWCGI